MRKPDDRARAADRKEVEESRRLGTDIRAIRAAILDCFEAADGGKAFRAALDERGLMLANGNKRDCFVIVDQVGGHHALNKKLTGHTLAKIRDRLVDLDRAQLPGVEQAQAMQRERHHEVERTPEPAAPTHQHRYDSLRETEREVQRDQFPGRYDELRAAEPPPEILREFTAEAASTTEPVAPNWDRDQANRDWEAGIEAAAIGAQEARQQPDASAGRETRAGAGEPSHGPESDASIEARSTPEPETVVAAAPAAEMRRTDRVASRISGSLASMAEGMLAGLFSIFGGGGPKLTRQQTRDQAKAETNEETLHASAYDAATRQNEAERDERIFNQDRQQQQADMSLSERFGTPPTREANLGREHDDDRGRERER